MTSCYSAFLLLLCVAVFLPLVTKGEQEVQDAFSRQLSSLPGGRNFGCNGRCFFRRGRAVRQCIRLRRVGGLCNVSRCGFRRFRCNFVAPPGYGCTGRCFIRRIRAFRQCALTRRIGGRCLVRFCSSAGRRLVSQCILIRRPPLFSILITPSPIPTIIVVAPSPSPITIIVPPPITATTSPSASISPTASTTETASPSVSPSVSVTPSVTPTSSVTPTPSQSCSFALTGPIGGTAINGLCTCGTSTASVTVLAAVSNNGASLPPFSMTAADAMVQMEAVNCYNGCVNDLFELACDPGSFATFSADATAVVNSCCNRCRNTSEANPGNGNGVSLATNQCFLVGP